MHCTTHGFCSSTCSNQIIKLLLKSAQHAVQYTAMHWAEIHAMLVILTRASLKSLQLPTQANNSLCSAWHCCCELYAQANWNSYFLVDGWGGGSVVQVAQCTAVYKTRMLCSDICFFTPLFYTLFLLLFLGNLLTFPFLAHFLFFCGSFSWPKPFSMAGKFATWIQHCFKKISVGSDNDTF